MIARLTTTKMVAENLQALVKRAPAGNPVFHEARQSTPAASPAASQAERKVSWALIAADGKAYLIEVTAMS